MKNLIQTIKSGKDLAKTFSFVMGNLYKNGPVSTTDMEILSYLSLYQPTQFELHRNAILNYMAVYYKQTDRNTLREVIFGQYARYIRESLDHDYTPVQADIVRGIENSKCFSFSAPTSTGKSYVFMNSIQEAKNDIVVVVPSRALINEYFLRLSERITDKSVNILTFIDKINTEKARKNVFIVTPERCRELFRQKNEFVIDVFLFDEAQLSDEESKRGLYFDSIVRRCQKAFPEAKFIFAHPFVQNPESQIQKNHFDTKTSSSYQYLQKNVGQLFYCQTKNQAFHHFGIDKKIMGETKLPADKDPIETAIRNRGSVLFYVTKPSIYNGKAIAKFEKYVALCQDLPNAEVQPYIELLKEYTGGETQIGKSHYSLLLDLLKKGIVIHHGSLPLHTRLIIEQFTKNGLCRICFATSTLEQGINMPFDVVYLDRLEGSKPLSVKNLIGRAGRSTMDAKFDFGSVVISSEGNMSKFRKIMVQEEVLDNISSLEKNEQQDEEYNDFKEAILNGTYSDEFNLTEKDLEKLSTDSIDGIIENILNAVFIGNGLIELKDITNDLDFRLSFYSHFTSLYELFLGRYLSSGERNVLNTAIKIILWRIYGKTFKQICWYRYSYVTKSHLQKEYEDKHKEIAEIDAAFFTPYADLPNKDLNAFSLFPQGTKVKEVSYDWVMYDTYDYIDKLIGFKLSDIFYAAFIKHSEKYEDERAVRLAKYVKFGTDSDRSIWMLRYGLTFEDIEILGPHIRTIDSREIVFEKSIETVPFEQRTSVERFL